MLSIQNVCSIKHYAYSLKNKVSSLILNPVLFSPVRQTRRIFKVWSLVSQGMEVHNKFLLCGIRSDNLTFAAQRINRNIWVIWYRCCILRSGNLSKWFTLSDAGCFGGSLRKFVALFYLFGCMIVLTWFRDKCWCTGHIRGPILIIFTSAHWGRTFCHHSFTFTL